MNSLTELNNYNNSLSFTYADNRIADVKFNKLTTLNQSQIVDEGSIFDSSVGIEITDVANYPVSLPYYTIDVSGLSGVTVTWDTIPSGCTVTNPSTGVYKISGVNSKAIWDIVKFAKIHLPTGLPNAYYGNWSYTSRIDYINGTVGPLTKSWTTAVTVQDVTLMSNPGPFVYQTNASSTLTTYPQILSFNDITYPGATWTITAVPDNSLAIDSFSSSAVGGTFTFNNSTKGFTIVGSRTQVNAHLAALTINSNSANVDFNLSYLLQNNQDSVTDTKVQILRNSNIKLFSNAASSTIYYGEDEASYNVTGAPNITDLESDGTGPYTVVVGFSDSSAILSMTSAGQEGTTSYDTQEQKLTITGTKTQVNSHLNAIIISIAIDYSSQFTLNYSLTTSNDELVVKYQTLICNTNDTEVTNMNLSRNYTTNGGRLVFQSNIPYISDFDENAENQYTIFFTSDYGVWTLDDVSTYTTLTYTGTRTQVNNIFSQVKFYPYYNVTSDITFTYTQNKNNVFQTSVIGTMTPITGTAISVRNVTLTANQNWKPGIKEALYGKFDILLVGGGGGGGGANTLPIYEYGGGGGGGGGAVIALTNQTLSYQAYSIQIGNGGGGGLGQMPSLNGRDGGSTVAFGITALGGKGGKSQYNGADGGSGYTNNGILTTGYTGQSDFNPNTNTTYKYGGGGGAITNATSQNGVNGRLYDIFQTGSQVRYGASGGGGGIPFSRYNTGNGWELNPGGIYNGGDGGAIDNNGTFYGAGGGGGFNYPDEREHGGAGASGAVLIRIYPR